MLRGQSTIIVSSIDRTAARVSFFSNYRSLSQPAMKLRK
jgi:hypothetical protein